MAEDELSRACSISWRELSKVTPWGDVFEGVAPGGRYVDVERNYLWAEQPGGDILVEVVVSGGTSRYEHGARASRIIKKGTA
nr:hypothetical protein [Caulobacter sp. NIBR2454]